MFRPEVRNGKETKVKVKPWGKGPPAPEPDCPCAETIEIGPGIVCELDVCAELVPGGFECLYVCPFIW